MSSTKRTRALWTRIAVVAVFAVAMAFLESAVVVYLREVFHYTGDLGTATPPARDVWFSIPFFTLLKPGALVKVLPMARIASVEVWREAATMVMLACVGWLAGTGWKSRGSYFIFAFGLWDIGYYAFLRLLLGWPTSLGSLDVLFLIPGPWVAPVFVPMAVSLAWIVTAVLVLRREAR
jgi:hypothetical protein